MDRGAAYGAFAEAFAPLAGAMLVVALGSDSACVEVGEAATASEAVASDVVAAITARCAAAPGGWCDEDLAANVVCGFVRAITAASGALAAGAGQHNSAGLPAYVALSATAGACAAALQQQGTALRCGSVAGHQGLAADTRALPLCPPRSEGTQIGLLHGLMEAAHAAASLSASLAAGPGQGDSGGDGNSGCVSGEEAEERGRAVGAAVAARVAATLEAIISRTGREARLRECTTYVGRALLR